MPSQLGQEVNDVRLHHNALVLAAEMFRQPRRNCWVIERALSHAILLGKCDGVGAYVCRGLRHECHDCRRIETRAEERSDGHIADHLRFHGMTEAVPDFGCQVGFGARKRGCRRRKTEIPVLSDLQLTVTKDAIVPGGELGNAPENGLGIGHPQKGQVLVQRLPIDLSAHSRHLQQRFNFRSKGKLASALGVVKRLHAEVITRDEQQRRSGTQVADAEGEHPI